MCRIRASKCKVGSGGRRRDCVMAESILVPVLVLLFEHREG